MTGVSAPSGEFDLIRRHFAPLALPAGLDLRDDAAVFAVPSGCELVATTDTIVAGIHYLEDEAPASIARRLLRVNISDLAAMGADPLGYLLSTALPAGVDDAWLAAFAAGLAADQAEFGIGLLGGDTVAARGAAVFGLTALGTVPAGQALRRAGARVGDTIYVTGTIGDAALGLLAARDALPELAPVLAAALEARYRQPEPRLGAGRALRGHASAAADVSDGLVADLGHVCTASQVAAVVESARVPLSPAARAAIAADTGRLVTALTGGDDYELVFTAAGALPDLGVVVTAIGRIEAGQGVRVLGPDGAPLALDRAGYRHF